MVEKTAPAQKEGHEPEYNKSATLKLKSDPKTKDFLKWAQENGVIMSKVSRCLIILLQIDFPAIFGSCLQGVICTEKIKSNEAFIFVPNKLIITIERAKFSELSYVFKAHESVFKGDYNSDFLALLIFVMHEVTKGIESFWHPYFNMIDAGTMFPYWPQKVLE